MKWYALNMKRWFILFVVVGLVCAASRGYVVELLTYNWELWSHCWWLQFSQGFMWIVGDDPTIDGFQLYKDLGYTQYPHALHWGLGWGAVTSYMVQFGIFWILATITWKLWKKAGQ